jgi:predicted ferric reductase
MYPYSANLDGVLISEDNIATWLLLSILVISLSLTLLLRWTKMFGDYLRLLSVLPQPSNQHYFSGNRTTWMPWLKKNLLYAPLWKKRHNQEFALSKSVSMGTLPGRGHFALIAVYIVFNIGWMFKLPYGEPKEKLLAALRGRSGDIAAFNLVPTIVFALRNNPLIQLLYVPFDTFQLFHRWAARIFIAEAVIHAAAWITSTRDAGGWHAVGLGLSAGPHAASFLWGLVGVVAGGFVLVQSWSPLRHAFYEAFILLHKVLVFLILLGVHLHLRLDKLPQDPWLKAVWCLWAYDYACRIYRIVRYNVNFSDRRWCSPVTVEALPGGACRVTFHLPNHWRPRPGAHVNAYLPHFGALESHPFSVAWADEIELPGQAVPADEKLPTTESEATKTLDEAKRRRFRTDVSLVIRAREGFTGDLHRRVAAQPGRRQATWGFCEGFYGGHDALASYSDVLLLAGGVGVTHQIMFARELLRRRDAGLCAARRVRLVWSCQDAAQLDWVRPWMNEVLAMPGRRDALRVDVFVTRQRLPDERKFASGSHSITLTGGRCNVQTVVDEEVCARQGALVVSVCGPGAFADSARKAVRRRVKVGVVDFIEEAFTY